MVEASEKSGSGRRLERDMKRSKEETGEGERPPVAAGRGFF